MKVIDLLNKTDSALLICREDENEVCYKGIVLDPCSTNPLKLFQLINILNLEVKNISTAPRGVDTIKVITY